MMLLIKLFLQSLVLDEFYHLRLGKHFFALALQLLQRIGIHILDLNSDHILILSKGINCVVIIEAAHAEFVGNVFAGSIWVRVQAAYLKVQVDSALDHHAAQLSATQYADS